MAILSEDQFFMISRGMIKAEKVHEQYLKDMAHAVNEMLVNVVNSIRGEGQLSVTFSAVGGEPHVSYGPGHVYRWGYEYRNPMDNEPIPELAPLAVAMITAENITGRWSLATPDDIHLDVRKG